MENGEEHQSVLRFTIPIEPKSVQKGARFTKKGHAWTDPKKKLYIDQIITESRYYAPDKPLEGPIEILMLFCMPRPKRLKNSKPWEEIHAQKPDYDNLAKGTQDGLGKAGFWKDDSQIALATIGKIFHEEDLFPRIEVTIKPLRQLTDIWKRFSEFTHQT